MSTTDDTGAAAAADQESRDAELVNQAMKGIMAGDLDGAERILRDVARRAPKGYRRDSDGPNGELVVRFWDQTEFIHFATLHGKQLGREIVWRVAAYPRALYYLGFLHVKKGRPAEAVAFLDAGLELEPRNAMLRLEKAKALGMMKDLDGQLRLATEVVEMGDEVPGIQRAVAMRSAGFVLIERGELDAAEAWFKRSLELDPTSHVAANELEYIRRLRLGAERAPAQTVSTGSNPQNRCARCGQPMTGKGRVFNVQGRILFLCEACDRKRTKKWWQFWK